MKNPTITIKNTDLNPNSMINFEPSDEELELIEEEIEKLINKN